MLTNERIEELLGLCRKATAGEWKLWFDQNGYHNPSRGYLRIRLETDKWPNTDLTVGHYVEGKKSEEVVKANAVFIVAARTALPVALKALVEARKWNKKHTEIWKKEEKAWKAKEIEMYEELAKIKGGVEEIHEGILLEFSTSRLIRLYEKLFPTPKE